MLNGHPIASNSPAKMARCFWLLSCNQCKGLKCHLCTRQKVIVTGSLQAEPQEEFCLCYDSCLTCISGKHWPGGTEVGMPCLYFHHAGYVAAQAQPKMASSFCTVGHYRRKQITGCRMQAVHLVRNAISSCAHVLRCRGAKTCHCTWLAVLASTMQCMVSMQCLCCRWMS